jgi:hypothetical protein
MLPNEVFFSYANQDGEIAQKIVGLLRNHGVPIFFGPSNVVGAQQWQDEILQGLRRCDWFVVLLSPNAVQSMWVKRETAFALDDRRYEGRIVPLLHQDCDLGTLAWLKLFQIVDFRADFEEACRQLLRVWGLGLKT